MLPRAREGHCVLPKASGVAVPTTRHLLGGVGAHFRGIPLLGSSPLHWGLPFTFYLFVSVKRQNTLI